LTLTIFTTHCASTLLTIIRTPGLPVRLKLCYNFQVILAIATSKCRVALLLCLIPTLSAISALPVPTHKEAQNLWVLQPVVRPDVPAGVTKSANPIDAFIAAEYQAK